MLFWLMLIILAVGIVGIVLTKNNWKLEVPNFFSVLITIIAVMVLIVMLVIIMVNYIGADACVADKNDEDKNLKALESVIENFDRDIDAMRHSGFPALEITDTDYQLRKLIDDFYSLREHWYE